MTSSIALKHRVAVSPEVCLPATIAGISWCHAHRDDIALLVEVAAADSFEFDFDEPGIDPVQDWPLPLTSRGALWPMDWSPPAGYTKRWPGSLLKEWCTLNTEEKA